MSLGLPRMIYADGIQKSRTVQFGGYDHSLAAGDGALWDMTNLSGDRYPLLAPRKRRYLVGTLTKPNGLFAFDGLYWVDGTGFYADGVRKGTVTDSKKQFCSLGAYLVIFPDKAYYNRLTGEFGSLAAVWGGTQGASVTIRDGTYAGETAKANTIYAAGVTWTDFFKAGDAVTIAGCTVHTANNKTAIIREVSGNSLRFYENTFTISGTSEAESAVTMTREVPDLDFLCQNENRLWGCKADTIYCSKLGDIFNWNVFDGVATDSYAVNVGSAGDFTGCCSYLGYPCFFKEEHIYKVYGSKPANFQVMGSADLGVLPGGGGSLAVAGEVLFYLSRAGVVAYSGGIPQSIATAFGTDRYRQAVAGSDGVKYYASLEGADGAWALFVYDTRTQLWHKEDGLQAVGFAWSGALFVLDSQGRLWMNEEDSSKLPALAGDTVPTLEAPVTSMAEFADFVEQSPNKKGTSRLQARMELDTGSSVSIDMQFDSDGVWRNVATLFAAAKRSYALPIIPRRSDHFRIRFTGTGDWRLSSLVRESYGGSEQ